VLLGAAYLLPVHLQLIKQHIVNVYKVVTPLLLRIIAIVLYLQNRGFGRDIGGNVCGSVRGGRGEIVTRGELRA
jgi:hypothetical protein